MASLGKFVSVIGICLTDVCTARCVYIYSISPYHSVYNICIYIYIIICIYLLQAKTSCFDPHLSVLGSSTTSYYQRRRLRRWTCMVGLDVAGWKGSTCRRSTKLPVDNQIAPSTNRIVPLWNLIPQVLNPWFKIHHPKSPTDVEIDFPGVVQWRHRRCREERCHGHPRHFFLKRDLLGSRLSACFDWKAGRCLHEACFCRRAWEISCRKTGISQNFHMKTCPDHPKLSTDPLTGTFLLSKYCIFSRTVSASQAHDSSILSISWPS